MVAGCPNDCIVGNGYASVLPLFAEHYGRELTLVHLRRKDRQACIASLRRNAELFPQAYGYYISDKIAQSKRMAAFHFSEKSLPEWMSLSLDERLAWYYDKTHALIDEYSTLFANYVEIDTEDLKNEAARRSLARAIGIMDRIPPPTHLNAVQAALGSIDPEKQHYVNWLLGHFNLAEVATDRLERLITSSKSSSRGPDMKSRKPHSLIQ
jgi:hypothetical protein